MIRVVSGEFGGRKLLVPDGLGTRPTTDKVRQAVFNSLDSAGLIDGAAVADLFAGSGALGIEACREVRPAACSSNVTAPRCKPCERTSLRSASPIGRRSSPPMCRHGRLLFAASTWR